MATHDRDRDRDHGSLDDARCGCASCAGGDERALWRVAGAELVGTALLVLLTCLGAMGGAGEEQPALRRALAGGLAVAALVQALDHVSGAHLNPAVSLAAALWGRERRARLAAMAAAQLLGAALGAGALRAGAGRGAVLRCVTRAPALAPAAAAAAEALLAGCLALLNCASWDPRVAPLRDSWPLRVGLGVAGLSLAGADLTGASMNPARSFGPALCSGDWAHHWVYWVGPLSGSALFTGLYVLMWRPRNWRPRHDAPPDNKAPLPASAPHKLHRSV